MVENPTRSIFGQVCIQLFDLCSKISICSFSFCLQLMGVVNRGFAFLESCLIFSELTCRILHLMSERVRQTGAC